MAITITQEKKKQRYLILAVVAIIFATLAVIWLGFLRGQKDVSQPQIQGTVYAVPEVDIDWQILEDIQAETPEPFEEIKPLEDDFGRENPFIPY